MNTSLIIGIAVSAIFIVSVIIPLLNKKGINTGGILTQTEKGINTAEGITDTISGMVSVPYINVIKEIIKLSEIGVLKAEQLYKISQLPKDDRKQSAVQFVRDILRLAAIDITPELESIIDGAIEAAVLLLPKNV